MERAYKKGNEESSQSISGTTSYCEGKRVWKGIQGAVQFRERAFEKTNQKEVGESVTPISERQLRFGNMKKKTGTAPRKDS